MPPSEHADPEVKPKKRKKKHKKPPADASSTAKVAVADDSGATTSVDNQPSDQSQIRKIAVRQQSSTNVAPPSDDAGSGETTINVPSAIAPVVPVDLASYATGYYGALLTTKAAEQLCRSLALSQRHVAKLRRVFAREDLHGDGEITPDEFLSIIGEDRRQLTLGMFAFVGLDANPRWLKFDDFVLCIATFAVLTPPELLLYAFALFDKDASGAMDAQELKAFCNDLRNHQFFFGQNVATAEKKLIEKETRRTRGKREALVDYEDIAHGSSQFQAAFYPIHQFQRNIRASTLGETFWAKTMARKQGIEIVVHYMRLHGGKLPPMTIRMFLRSLVSPEVYGIRKAAVVKHAEELRIRKELDEQGKLEQK